MFLFEPITVVRGMESSDWSDMGQVWIVDGLIPPETTVRGCPMGKRGSYQKTREDMLVR